MTVCQIFFKLKFSKFIQDIRILESFGKFLLIVQCTTFAGYDFLAKHWAKLADKAGLEFLRAEMCSMIKYRDGTTLQN